MTPIEAKEIVYQSVPYVGMAKAFEIIHATNEVLTARKPGRARSIRLLIDPETLPNL